VAVVLLLIQVGDECIVAPLSLFQPELFGVTGPKVVHIQQRAGGDPEDPHDENYLRETSVSCGVVHVEFYNSHIFETLFDIGLVGAIVVEACTEHNIMFQ
jgi:hypothetical protein